MMWGKARQQARQLLETGDLDAARAAALRLGKGGGDGKARVEVAQGLLARARRRLGMMELSAAVTDADHAAELGASGDEVEQIRHKAGELALAERDARRQQNGVLAKVGAHLRQHQLTQGASALAALVSPDERAQAMRHEIEAQKAARDAHAARLESALARHDLAEALRAASALAMTAPPTGQAAELTHKAVQLAAAEAAEHLAKGSLSAAQTILALAAGTGREDAELAEAQQLMRRCELIAAALSQHRWRDASAMLAALGKRFPKAGWITEASSRAADAADAIEQLFAGPLGVLAQVSVPAVSQRLSASLALSTSPTLHGGSQPAAALAPQPAPTPESAGPTRLLPRRFALLADGVGAFLVVQEGSVTVGPSRGQRVHDVAFLADSALPSVRLERDDADWVLSARTPVQVNGKAVTEHVLADGDRVALSPAVRFRVSVPEPASATVVLRLEAGRLERGDIRTVLLMGEALIVGAGQATHVRDDQLTGKLTLTVREGLLRVRGGGPMLVDGRLADPGQAVGLGQRLESAGASVTLAEL